MPRAQRLRVACVTTYDARDVNQWSGLGYYIGKTLERHVGDVTYIGTLRDPSTICDRIVRKAYHTFARSDYSVERTERVGKAYAREVESRMSGNTFDVIVALGTIPVAYMTSDVPLIVYADATFASMIGYYYTRLSKASIVDGHRMERTAYQRAARLVFASEWAAESAMRTYGIPSERVFVLPFGPNVTDIPSRRELKKGVGDPLRLLFVGKDWERKGGSIAYAVLRRLNDHGVRAALYIVGCDPSEVKGDPRVVVEPYLDKSNTRDAEVLRGLFTSADFFIFPTQQECFGVVICEAFAHGLPVLTNKTGGPSSIVAHEQNGFLAEKNSVDEYVAFILGHLDRKRHQRLRDEARHAYEMTFNWETTGKRMHRIICDALS